MPFLTESKDVQMPELEKSKFDDVDVTKLLESFKKKVKEFIQSKKTVLDLLILFMYKTESKSEFEMGLSLLREGMEAGGKIDSASPSFLAVQEDESRFLTTIQAMIDYPSFASILLENVAFRRSFWALACHWIEQDKLLDRCVRFVSNREPDVNTVHPVLHIVAYLESRKHNKEALALMDAVNKSVSNQSRPTSISLLLLRKLSARHMQRSSLRCHCKVCAQITHNTCFVHHVRIGTQVMDRLCVAVSMALRSVSGKDEVSQGHPHAMCNQVVRSLLEATDLHCVNAVKFSVHPRFDLRLRDP